MFREDVTKPAMSEGASSMVFASNKDGKGGFSVDYRKLDEMNVRDTHQLQQMNKCIDLSESASSSSTISCNSRYCQIEISESDHEKNH